MGDWFFFWVVVYVVVYIFIVYINGIFFKFNIIEYIFQVYICLGSIGYCVYFLLIVFGRWVEFGLAVVVIFQCEGIGVVLEFIFKFLNCVGFFLVYGFVFYGQGLGIYIDFIFFWWDVVVVDEEFICWCEFVVQ